MNWSQFRQLIDTHFDLEELRTLCFDLGVDYDALRGEGKVAKIREMVAMFRRNDRLPELVAALKQVRPFVDWEKITVYQRVGLAHLPERQSLWLSGGLVVIAIIISLGFVFYARALPNNTNAVVLTTTTPAHTQLATNSATPTPTSPVTATASMTPAPAAPATTPATPTTPATATSTVAAVGPGEYMVLVAQLEPIGASERDVTRFIVDDLRQLLELSLPFSRIRVRSYPTIVSSEAEAQQAAEATGATVVVWGNYSDDLIELEVQLGSLQSFSEIPFDYELLARLSNVRVHMEDERRQSIARQVLVMLFNLETAASNIFRVLQLSVMHNELQITPAVLVGQSTAVHLHRFSDAFYTDPPSSLENINAALKLDNNPILYFYRGVTHTRSGNFQAAEQDFQTALRLQPEGWPTPRSYTGFQALFLGDYRRSVDEYTKFVGQRPDDWYAHYVKGMALYFAGDYEAAGESLAQSIALEPEANWPYVFAIQVALREGRVSDAVALANVVLEKFPDPDSGNRVLSALVGDTALGMMVSAFGNGILGQYVQVLADVEKALLLDPQRAELYWMQGFAHCNLGNYETAEAAYTRGMEVDPGYMLLYLSRAEVRLRQGLAAEAQADFETIENSELGEVFADAVMAVQFGLLTCENYLTFQVN